jgi:dTDP-4-dehydrorhamnose reductase
MASGESVISAGSGRQLRVLVLGGTGMLGHKLVQRLAARGLWVAATIRTASAPKTAASREALGRAQRLIENVDVLRDDALARAFASAEPDVVVNAVGVIKQLDAAKQPTPSILTNSLLPHRIAAICAERGARLIHLSTDCVFAGREGPYTESDSPDAEDLYGRSKLLGEVSQPGCLTLRSSIVGRELRGGSGVIEWFLSQRGKRVTGYARALYTGMTTNVMADLIGRLAIDHPQLHGIWQVASESISKYELLALVNSHFKLGIELIRDENFVIDRRLDGSRFRAQTGFSAPDWDAMIAGMKADPTPYDT